MPSASAIVYVRCTCGDRIREPFSRYSGPVPFVHRSRGGLGKGNGCRLVVTPDPVGDAHQVQRVPNDQRIEDVLADAITRHRANAECSRG